MTQEFIDDLVAQVLISNYDPPVASGGTASGYLRFNGFEFFDDSGNPIPGVTYTLIETPEPAAGMLLLTGLALVYGVSKRRLKPSVK